MAPVTLDQKNRPARFTSPLGPNVLALARFEGQEALSEPFEFVVDALSTDENIDFDRIIGQNCLVTVNSYKRPRKFNGVLTEAVWNGVRSNYYSYRLVLRPWFWLMSHRADCRFFQEMTVPDILRKVFSGLGSSSFEFRLNEKYKPLEYCVQYRESDFAFASRLMEEFGIYYYFEHDDAAHKMILADSAGAHRPLADGPTPLIPLTGGYVRREEHFQHWTSERRFRSGKFSVEDYYFETPNAQLESHAQSSEKYPSNSFEIYDYPARHREQGTGEFFAKVRRDAEQSLDHRRMTAGEAPGIYPGAKVTLKGHTTASENGDYIAVRATHIVGEQTYAATSNNARQGKTYQGSYVLTPYSRPFKAPLLTPKPVIHGVQTAKVVGESGEEITVDKYGRVKVQFFWDRQDKQSCWIRVAEVWASKNWGGVFHPRHGQEVVVAFLEGDPDRPLIVGTLYHAEHMPPYDLPAKKTIGGLKSNSTIGGGGYNEFIFDDHKGSEQIRMHAQNNHDVVVRNKETENIGTAFMPPIGQPSRDVTVERGDDHLKVAIGNQKIDIAMNQDETVGVVKRTTVGVSEVRIVGGTRITSVGATDMTQVGAMLRLSVGATSITLTPAALLIESPAIKLTSAAVLIDATTLINGKLPKPIVTCGKLIVT